MLDAWSSPTIDPERARRLLLGGCVGAILLLAGGYAAVAMVHQPAPSKPEKKRDRVIENIALVDEPEGGAGGPPPATEAPPPALTPPPPAPVVQPKAAPAAKFDYADESPAALAGGGGGTGSGSGNGTGTGNGAKPAPPPAPPPPPPPAKVEPPKPAAPAAPDPTDYDPPKCKKRGIDSAQAKALGVEGRVVVSYTVTASGAVSNVRAVSGPSELQALAVAAVSAWSCEPARMKEGGAPVVVTKKVPLTVTLK